MAVLWQCFITGGGACVTNWGPRVARHDVHTPSPSRPPSMGERRGEKAPALRVIENKKLQSIYLSFIYYFLTESYLFCYWIGRVKDFNLMEGGDFCCLKCRMKFIQSYRAALFMFGWLICVYANSKESDFIFPWLVFWIKHGHIWTVGFYLSSDALGNDLWGVCCILNHYRGVQVVASNWTCLPPHRHKSCIFSQDISTALSLSSWKISICFTKS